MPQVGFIPIGCSRFDLNMCAVVLRRAVAVLVLMFAVGGAAAQDFSPLPSMARVANQTAPVRKRQSVLVRARGWDRVPHVVRSKAAVSTTARAPTVFSVTGGNIGGNELLSSDFARNSTLTTYCFHATN